MGGSGSRSWLEGLAVERTLGRWRCVCVFRVVWTVGRRTCWGCFVRKDEPLEPCSAVLRSKKRRAPLRDNEFRAGRKKRTELELELEVDGECEGWSWLLARRSLGSLYDGNLT
jgi:hypothetical protein